MSAAEACPSPAAMFGVHSFPNGGACACGQTYAGMLDAIARESGYADWEALKWRGIKQNRHDDGGSCVGHICCNERMCRSHLREHKAKVHGETSGPDRCTLCKRELPDEHLTSPAGAPWCGSCPRWWFE